MAADISISVGAQGAGSTAAQEKTGVPTLSVIRCN